jgi:uncharacterized repeat protein (TIGR01451 family)
LPVEKYWKSAIMNVTKFTSKSLNHHKIPKRAIRHHSQYPRRKGMKTMLRSMMIVCMLSAVLTVSPTPVLAQVDVAQGSMPQGLQEAILASTTKPFHESGGKYSTSSNGVNIELNVSGLQAGGEGLQWGIALQGFGRGTEIMDVSAPKISQVGGRLEYQRDQLTEWYRDSALGVEQGFTIHEPPVGEDELIVQLKLATDMEGILDENSRGLSFPGPEGQTLRYDHLKVYDANGAELVARMVYEPGQLMIQVNDRGAVYPITIDPLIYLEQKVITLDGATYDSLGVSVALSGDTALVGADQDDVGVNIDQGSVYVFLLVGDTWIQQAQLTASDGGENDSFGHSVALSGDTALVGAYTDDVDAINDQGSAYIFVRSDEIWTEQAQLTASDGDAEDRFGKSVALSGNTALVGAYGARDWQGSAYVFVRSGTTWTEQALLTDLNGVAGDSFGYSVALSGNTALVGSICDDAAKGSAFVFVRSGTTWDKQTQLTALDGAAGDWFSWSVALYGNTALVGAINHTVEATVRQGAVYVFRRDGTSWSQETELTAADGATDDSFGGSVALSGDTALVGARIDSVGANSSQGSAYVFVRIGTVWTEQTQLIASDGAVDDYFGTSVALSGDTALVGALTDDVDANSDQGSAYFYQTYRTDADLAVSAVRGSTRPAHPGNQVRIAASVLNYGPQPATTVLLNVSLPTGLTYVSHVTTRGAYHPSINSWSVGNLPVGVRATLTIIATVDNIGNQNLIFAPYLLGRDINDANNSASLTLPVNTPFQIALNGGFNTYAGTSKIPQNWVAVNFATTDGKITTVKQEGTASVKIRNTSAVDKMLVQKLTMPGNKGDEFVLTFYVKGSAIPVAGVCRVEVELWGATARVTTQRVDCSPGTYGFTQRILNFRSPGSYGTVYIRLVYEKATGTIYFDGLSLMRAP